MAGDTNPPVLGEERIPTGEAAQIEQITAIHLSVTDRAQKPVLRGQHMKGHGCVRAEFIVEPNLSESLRLGIFREPRTFPAYVRFSNGKGFDDREGDAHGMAIKLLNVEGEKLLEDEKSALTQDFVLIDHPVFFIKNVADYVPFMQDFRNLRAAGLTLGKVVAGIKLFVSPDYKWRLLRATGSKKPDSPLRIQYWSTTPSRLGPVAVKYSARPDLSVAPAVAPIDSPNKLRQAMSAHLKDKEARFDFLIQTQSDPVAMPVEDPTVDWGAHWQKVATIRIPPQSFESPAQMTFGENLSFTPWHSLPDHRPLGGINRARRAIYLAISKQRHELNGAPRIEPTD
jgi:Catalase